MSHTDDSDSVSKCARNDISESVLLSYLGEESRVQHLPELVKVSNGLIIKFKYQHPECIHLQQMKINECDLDRKFNYKKRCVYCTGAGIELQLPEVPATVL